MICPYLRSSSINQFKTCEMRYFLEYVLGFKSPTGKKACLGTMFHKVFEVRSLAKLAIQRNEKLILDENLGELTIDECRNTHDIVEKAFNYYKGVESHLEFTNGDLKNVKSWADFTLTNWPHYDPFNLNLVASELYFDIEIEREWAKLKGVLGGQEIDGHLRIKGTMDMVIDLGNNVYELLDWKTGEHRKDFATGEEKTIDYMENDNQLLLYLLALKTIFPDKNFVLSLAWIRAGGIFTVYGDDDMLGRAWEMLEKNFKEISKNYTPRQLDPIHRDYRCKYLCAFSKPHENGSKSICQHFKEQISKNGLTKVANQNIDMATFGCYGSGGGKTNIGR